MTYRYSLKEIQQLLNTHSDTVIGTDVPSAFEKQAGMLLQEISELSEHSVDIDRLGEAYINLMLTSVNLQLIKGCNKVMILIAPDAFLHYTCKMENPHSIALMNHLSALQYGTSFENIPEEVSEEVSEAEPEAELPVVTILNKILDQ